MCPNENPGERKKTGGYSMIALTKAAEETPCDMSFCEMFLRQPKGNS